MYHSQGVWRRESGSVSAVWAVRRHGTRCPDGCSRSCRSCWDLARKHQRHSSVGSPTADLLLVGLSGGSGGQSRVRAALTRSCPPRPRRKDSPSFLDRHADSYPHWSGDPMSDGVNRAGDFGHPCARLRKLSAGRWPRPIFEHDTTGLGARDRHPQISDSPSRCTCVHRERNRPRARVEAVVGLPRRTPDRAVCRSSTGTPR